MFQRPFSFYRTPKVIFGENSILSLGALAHSFGDNAIVVRGSQSLANSGKWDDITRSLTEQNIQFSTYEVSGEPSPDFVDRIVNVHRNSSISVVIAIGGGSAVDAGKAVSAMLTTDRSVIDYLEVVGTKQHNGNKVPFIAVPTTAGTGSEASANAVLTKVGADGYKRSLRHDNFCPDIALIDPTLALSCPPSITSACGMDALTQLIESYVSDKASPFTDSLIEKALPMIGQNIIDVSTTRGNDPSARAAMAYASLISGITLANAGLGVVHGFASPIGGYFSIPHGVVCGSLLAPATKVTIEKLKRTTIDHIALKKYSYVYSLLTGKTSGPIENGCGALIDILEKWTEVLSIPRLSNFGVTIKDIPKIVESSGNKNNPVKLTPDEMSAILLARI